MTLQTLRNLITVSKYILTAEGAIISYTRKDKGDKPFHYIVPPIETTQGLGAIASIEDYSQSPLSITMEDGTTYTWENFVRNYQISQWEALSLIVRHELEMEEAIAMDAWEIEMAFKVLS